MVEPETRTEAKEPLPVSSSVSRESSGDPDREATGQHGMASDIVRLIRRMMSRIYADSKHMVKRFGLTGPQALVLRTLLHHGPMLSATLADFIFVTPSNLTGIVDRLEQKGLVVRTRQAADRRALLLALTESGRRKAESLPDPIEEKLTAGLARVDPQQARQIRAAVETVVGFMDAEKAPDVPFDLGLAPPDE